MLARNRSILNREYILMNVLKVLASILSMLLSVSFFYQRLHMDVLHDLQIECSVHLT
jgi:hypothetical protein